MLKKVLFSFLETAIDIALDSNTSSNSNVDFSFLDDVDWYCDMCNDYLNSQPGFNTTCGDWQCTKCGAYNSIHEDEIIDLDDNFELDSYSNDLADEPGCRACGNPAYPNCKAGCPMFDD